MIYAFQPITHPIFLEVMRTHEITNDIIIDCLKELPAKPENEMAVGSLSPRTAIAYTAYILKTNNVRRLELRALEDALDPVGRFKSLDPLRQQCVVAANTARNLLVEDYFRYSIQKGLFVRKDGIVTTLK